MKKIILTAILLAFTAALSFSQTITYDKNSLYVAGSADLNNGQCEITYTTDPSFIDTYVSLTPVGAYLQLYVEKKEKGVITVKCANSITGKFDYVIIVKKTREVPANTKNQ